jgi:hypothetical protein
MPVGLHAAGHAVLPLCTVHAALKADSQFTGSDRLS